MEVILDLSGFRKQVKIDRFQPVLKISWPQRLDPEPGNQPWDCIYPMPTLIFNHEGIDRETGLHLYSWDGENLFWGDRRPHRVVFGKQ